VTYIQNTIYEKLLLSALSLLMMATGMHAHAQNCTVGDYAVLNEGQNYDYTTLYTHEIVITEPTLINTLSTEIKAYELAYGNGQGRFVLVKLTSNYQFESIITSPRFSYSSLGFVDVIIDDITLAPGRYGLFNYLPNSAYPGYASYRYYSTSSTTGYIGNSSILNLLTANIDQDLSTISTLDINYWASQYSFNGLHMSYTSKEEITIPICAPSYTFNGVEYTENTTIYHNRRAGVSASCDSITATRLEFLNLINQDHNISQCESYTWPVNGETYTESTVVTFDAGQTVYGCDSTVTLNLTINERPSAAITLEEQTLTVTTTGDSYIWLDCNDEFTPILNANAQTFTPVRTGNYRAVVTTNGCSATTECMQVDYLGLDNPLANLLSVYPNPTNGVVNLDFGTELSLTSVELFNVNGQLIETISGAATASSMTFNVSQDAGVYLLKLTANEQTKTVRLIKQ
jgi:hypothetical protein